MDLLDRLLEHDCWTTRQFLDLCRDLPDEDLDREFDIGHRTLRRTLTHIVYNVEAWTDDMAGQPVRAESGESIAELTMRLDAAFADLRAIAHPIADREGWDETWSDVSSGQRRSYGGTLGHIVTHSMHHRAQVRYMLRQLGLKDLPEGDLLGWEKQATE